MNQTGRYAHLRFNKDFVQQSTNEEEQRQTNEFVNESYQEDFDDQISNLRETKF